MKYKKIISVLLCLLTSITCIACSNEAKMYNFTENKGEVVVAKYPKRVGFEDYDGKREVRNNNPVSDEYIATLMNFSAKTVPELLKKNNRDSNIMYSPLSLFMAISLAASGASNNTQEEMLSVLEMEDLGINILEEQTGNLYRLLYTDNEIGKLKLANSIWLDKDINFKESYINKATDNYYASAFSVDFSEKETGELMSQWISDNTNGILNGQNPPNKEQIMSLINTVYFYDEWIDKFNKNKTKEDIFYCHDGNEVNCDFMNMRFGSKGFYEGEGYICSSLGFKNNCSMKFYLPNKGIDVYELISSKDKVETLLNLNNSSNIKKYGEVTFKLPKFNYGSTLNLKKALEHMGMVDAFELNADFTGITDYEIAYISNVIQSSHISINEKGCEASSYTQIDYAGCAIPKDKAEMILDRPFIYTITSTNGVVLFIGVVNNPMG